MEREEIARNVSELDDYEIDRVDTVFRVLDSILFAIVFSLVESVVAIIVVFQLGYSLVTEKPPSRRVRDLGNRLSSYGYQLLRYLTHNSAERPFPFSDFPAALEEPRWPYPRSVRGARNRGEIFDEDDEDLREYRSD
jgi:hypothetical protein